MLEAEPDNLPERRVTPAEFARAAVAAGWQDRSVTEFLKPFNMHAADVTAAVGYGQGRALLTVRIPDRYGRD